MRKFNRGDTQRVRSVYARRKTDYIPHYRPDDPPREQSLRQYAILQYDALLQKADEDISVFSTMINESNDAFLVADPITGELLYVNGRVCARLQYSRKELLSLNIARIFPEKASAIDWERTVRTVREQGRLRCETACAGRNGAAFPVELSVVLCTHEKREYAVCIARDISRRRKSEEHLLCVTRALRILSRCNETIVHAGDEISLLKDACRIVVEDGGYRMAWVGNHEEDTGPLRPVAWAGDEQDFLDTQKIRSHGAGSDDRPGDAAVRTGRTCLVRDLRTSRRDGSSGPALGLPLKFGADTIAALSIHASAPDSFAPDEVRLLEDLASKLSYGIMSIRVREEHRYAARTLSRTLHEFESIMLAIPDILFRTDLEGRLVMWNKAFEAFTGLPPRELSGRPASSFFAEGDRPSVSAALAACCSGGESEMELPLLNNRGVPVVFNWKTAPMRDEHGKAVGILSIARDITEHRRAEENERRLQAQFLQSQKMEAIGQLAGGIAHDFNNILTAIIGYGNIMTKKLPETDKNRIFADNIVTAANRAANLTRSLLTFSRKQAINPRQTDANVIIEGVEKLLRRVIGEDIEVSVQLRPDLAPVLVDAAQLEQVLINLATNARDAMPAGGRLSFTTGMGEIDEEFIRTNGYGKPGTCVVITVTDTGTGMPQETKQRIFEPFFTTKEVGKGTGLGLSMAYGSVKQHNGYITAESEPGRGTTFRIYLPVLAAKICETESLAPVAAPQGGTETILLAEDDADVRRLEKSLLEDSGYTVIEAVDGQDAMDKLRMHGDRIRLLISDVIMPKKSGGDVLEEAKRIQPGVKALFASGYPAEIIRNRDVAGRAFHFVSKPISPPDFLKKVREVLDQE